MNNFSYSYKSNQRDQQNPRPSDLLDFGGEQSPHTPRQANPKINETMIA